VASGNGRRVSRSLEAARAYLQKSYLINTYAFGGQAVQAEQADEVLLMNLERVIAKRCRKLFATSKAKAEAALIEGIAQANQILDDVYQGSVLRLRDELQKLLAKLKNYEGKLQIRLNRLQAKARVKDAEGLAAVRVGDLSRASNVARSKLEIERKIAKTKSRLSKIRTLRAKIEDVLERINDLPDELMVLNFRLDEVEMDELVDVYRVINERLESISRKVSQIDAMISATLGDVEDPEAEEEIDKILDDWINTIKKENDALDDVLSKFKDKQDTVDEEED